MKDDDNFTAADKVGIYKLCGKEIKFELAGVYIVRPFLVGMYWRFW